MTAPDGRIWAAVEAGGTKFRAALFDDDLEVVAETRVQTADPDQTLDATIAFFAGTGSSIAGLGIASFGPLDLRRGSATYGSMMSTPKPGWSGAPVLSRLQSALAVPAAIETDVGGAALAEGSVGAGAGLDVIAYVTVGTGIGGAVLAGGAVHRGHGHSEIGHIPIVRRGGDGFAGACPFHGDCLEGMASGAAVEARKAAGDESPGRFVAAYLGQLVRTLTYAVAPDRIIFGGGLFHDPDLMSGVRATANMELGGYSTNPDVVGDLDTYVAPAALGQDAGLVGAGLLARRAGGAA